MKAIVIGLAIPTIFLSACSQDPCSPTAAKDAAADYMKAATRDPHQAKFHNLIASSTSSSSGSCKFEVTGSMEGQNAFGAMTEIPFTLQAELNGNNRFNIELTRAPGILELMR